MPLLLVVPEIILYLQNNDVNDCRNNQEQLRRCNRRHSGKTVTKQGNQGKEVAAAFPGEITAGEDWKQDSDKSTRPGTDRGFRTVDSEFQINEGMFDVP
jgi:hypothetical protein